MACDFEASNNEYFESISSVSSSSNGTVCFWVYIESETANNYRLIGNHNNAEVRFFYVSPANRPTNATCAVDYLGFFYHDAGNYISINTWHHLAATWTSGTSKVLFQNGVALTGSSSSGTDSNSSDTMLIGSSQSDTAQSFDGKAEDIRLYDRVLSDEEIATIYKARGIDNILDGLISKYTFSEVSPGSNWSGSSSLKDLSGSQNHASPVTSPTAIEASQLIKVR